MSSNKLFLPTLGDSIFSPHPYQQQAIDKITDHFFDQGRRAAMIVLATGTGKTVVMACLVRKLIEDGKIDRALFIVHRNELVRQATETFENAGMAVGREQGSQHGLAMCNPNVVVSTVQSMSKRLHKYKADDFGLILIDESHHFSWKNLQYRSVVEHFEDAKFLGVTATPDRPDEASMEHFDEVVFKYDLKDAIHDPEGPFLAPVRFVRCNLGIDLRNIRTTGNRGDFDQGELGRRMQPGVELLANAISKEIVNRQKTIVFMPCVGSSTAMAHALHSLGFRAEWVSGDRPERDRIIQDYKKGRYNVLVNCQLLLEGFDDKPTDTVVLKPTRSRVAYSQMVGRATRLFEGKSDCLVVDFDHVTDMDLIGPSSLVTGSPDDAKAIDKIVNETGDLWGAVERNEENKRERKVWQVPVARLEDFKYPRVEVNPFESLINLGHHQAKLASKAFDELASPKQLEFLARNGMNNLGNISKRQASSLISQIIERRSSGHCTLRQLNYLVSLGVAPEKARHMSFEEASQTINQLRLEVRQRHV